MYILIYIDKQLIYRIYKHPGANIMLSIVELDREILGRVDNEQIHRLAIANKYWYSLYNDDITWKIRTEQQYQQYINEKTDNVTWREFYNNIGTAIYQSNKHPRALQFKHQDKSWFEFYYDLSKLKGIYADYNDVRYITQFLTCHTSISTKYKSLYDVVKYGVYMGMALDRDAIVILIDKAIVEDHLDDYIYIIQSYNNNHHDIDLLLRDASIKFLDYFWEIGNMPSEYMASQIFKMYEHSVYMLGQSNNKLLTPRYKDKIEWLKLHGYDNPSDNLVYTGKFNSCPKLVIFFDIIKKSVDILRYDLENCIGMKTSGCIYLSSPANTPKQIHSWFDSLFTCLNFATKGELTLQISDNSDIVELFDQHLPSLRYIRDSNIIKLFIGPLRELRC